ncbi:3-oxoacyl-[acyl-carrier-protein] synthase III C-terminal domain-containing protein [Tsukamurella strandjordii]|uniref:3-oxoacyl-[acyl-carrier-protein] synthase III C-terminal domain-containing protein n=1 Tax=Tsukamurella TaxID=2060 RepID=UPI001C7D4C03|nr:3-oxoacyl-[acyl-carrier-protein] synthase III C-terminal domain-containing protein [Tsukamurella sp. TY48]GIZ98852.1 putative 3-oxoacyl-ACP synthase III [Tsukamurella sp. TY48]
MDTHIMGLASYLPANRVPASYFREFADADSRTLSENPMFAPPAFRHHAGPEESNVDLMCAAIERLPEPAAAAVAGVDVILTHSQLPDLPVVGCGGDVARRLKLSPSLVLDLHNGGCAAFILMLHLARTLFAAGTARTALLLTATNAAGNVFTQDRVRTLPQAAIPGDGAAAAVVSAAADGEGITVREVVLAQHSEYAGDMTAAIDPPRKYWEAGSGQLHVGFTESKIAKVLARGNRLVPEVALAAAAAGGLRGPEVGHLVTNQPNRTFLRNWREALELPPERHPDTFDECGNLFAVGVPHTLATSLAQGRIDRGEPVVLAAFAHAGDFAAAALLQT